MRLIYILLIFSPLTLFSQVPTAELLVLIHNVTNADMNSITTPFEGSLAYSLDDSTIYVFDGSIWASLKGFKPQLVENELYFEDDDYHYVSLQIETTDYLVKRYAKDDINDEGEASGTGAQPTDLVTIQGLTFN